MRHAPYHACIVGWVVLQYVILQYTRASEFIKTHIVVVMTHNGSLEMMRTEFLCHKDHDFSLTVIPNIQISA